ncbi:alpha/beta-hydrolase, partial [Westerdykella ornata]
NRPPVVVLPGYGSFKGTRIIRHAHHGSTLDKPIDAWLGVEYAKQSRFAPPVWPKPFNGTRDASKYGPICIQGGNQNIQSEDCLNLNIYRPAGIPYSKKLPVLVFFHGGSFVMGSGRNFDGAGFVARSPVSLMVVTAQYRLSSLGSLPSALFEEEGLLNLGIQDQRMLLQFLQRYLSVFGGDPKRVTLSGQSAGAHAVGIHLFHHYGTDAGKPLFAQAILSSGSPTARSFPEATYPLYKRQFKEYMEYLKCPLAPNAAALRCLRGVDVDKIRTKQSRLYGASNYKITWPFQPVSPGPLLEKRGSVSGEDGTFWKIPTMISSCTDEGSSFAPKDLETTEDFTSFLHNVNPGLTAEDLVDLARLYPDPDEPTSPYWDSPKSKQFKRIVAAYGDYSYICPVQDAAVRLADAGVPVYKARFNTPNWGKDWEGVPHAADFMYFNGSPDVQFPEVSELYSSYWASFVATGDPNTYAAPGAPKWEMYKGLGKSQLAVGSRKGINGTRMEPEGHGIRMQACAWWRDPERMKRLRK